MTQPGVLTATGIDRSEGIALWRQIAGALERDIASGLHAPGGRLPTEAQLSARFGVNRHTVRRAIEQLARAGAVHVEQGRGTFVAEEVLEYEVGPRTRFSEWIRRHNKEPTGRQLQLRELPAEGAVAAGLGIPRGAAVVMLERLGLADDRPVCIARHYFAAQRLPGIADALRRHPGVTLALRALGVADYMRLVTRVTARMPSGAEASLLRTPRTRPVLVTENVNVDQAGAVLEYGTGIYPTPRVQIVFEP